MLPVVLILRNRCLRSLAPLQLKKFLSVAKDDGGSSDSSDDEREMRGVTKNKDALNRLNFLLQSMVKEEKKSPLSGLDKKLAKPKDRKKDKVEDNSENDRASETRLSGGELADAARKVAESLGTEVEQTESELLSKLRFHSLISAQDNGDQDARKPGFKLSELIVGMKIDRSQKAQGEVEYGRAQQVRIILSSQQEQRGHEKRFESRPPRDKTPRYRTPETFGAKVDIFGGEPLGIFKPSEAQKSSPKLTMWTQLQERELKLAITHPPANAFEEMILWTEQGKLWNFPINNEQGWEKEAEVSFVEHVFLEHHLEPWCPRQGPIRHFMELVCVGLSKNPYITVQDKHEHIEWYRKYFQEKQDLLKEIGVLGDVPVSNEKNIKG